MAAVRTMDTIWNDTVDPTVNSDSSIGVQTGDQWRNTTSKEVFECSDNSVGAAVWTSITEVITGTTVFLNGTVEIGDNAVLVAPAIAVDQDDYNPSDATKDFNTAGEIQVAFLVIDATSNIQITGFAAPSPAKRMRISVFNNSTASNVTFPVNDAGSVAANRILSNGNVTLNEKELIDFIYAPSELRWIPVVN